MVWGYRAVLLFKVAPEVVAVEQWMEPPVIRVAQVDQLLVQLAEAVRLEQQP
jgi:hypothetical protein